MLHRNISWVFRHMANYKEIVEVPQREGPSPIRGALGQTVRFPVDVEIVRAPYLFVVAVIDVKLADVLPRLFESQP